MHKVNTPQNKEIFFIASLAFYFCVMAEYNPILWEEYRKRYNKIPLICKDIDYLARKAFMQR